MPFSAVIIFVFPGRDVLISNIKKRITVMMQQGWAEEAEKLLGTSWEPFLQKKGFIGYVELINWIKQGKRKIDFDQVVTTIQSRTVAYAKRQVTFWKSFAKQLEGAAACVNKKCLLQVVTEIDVETATHITNQFAIFRNMK
jgi:tRNA A37 N6-isopentenylltransferase MiaA